MTLRAPAAIIAEVMEDLAPHVTVSSDQSPHEIDAGTMTVLHGEHSRLVHAVLDTIARKHGARFAFDELNALDGALAFTRGRGSVYATPRGAILARFGPHVFVVDRADRRTTCQLVRHTLATQMVLPALLRTGAITLHAAGVAAGDRAIALCAEKGSGKTTLQLKLIDRYPLAFLSGDRVFVRRESDRAVAYGWVWGLNLRPPSDDAGLASRLYRGCDVEAYRLSPGSDPRVRLTKRALRSAGVPMTARARLHAIVLVRFVPGGELSFESVAPRDAAASIAAANASLGALDTGFLLGGGTESTTLHQLERTLAGVRVYRLEYGKPSEPDALKRVYELLS